ncbi:MAG: hypothetical protein HY318_09765 [Armatimonadetes bacterium]|nr:hypothetical protein [Armatimonadota bacterium]
MSEVTLTVVDCQRAIHGHTHGSNTDPVIAALAADPETIDELEAAIERFIKPVQDRSFLAGFHVGASEEPWDAGIVIVDLAARIVAYQSTYSWPRPDGTVFQKPRDQNEDEVGIPYLLSPDWLFTEDVDCWSGLSSEQRAQRAALPPLDARAVLYGKATGFIVEQCLTAKAEGIANPITDIHARWLMTPREDLRGLNLREMMLEKREHLGWDMQWREHQWSLTGACPPGLSPESAAYRFSGFGTHEIVVYYDLVRCLLGDCWKSVSQQESAPHDEEVQRLERLMHDWLYSGQGDYSGRSPFYIIERERLRLPLALSAEEHHDAFPDDDCPLCQMLREGSDFGPTFWHLDGCNMDDDFAFSFHRTREEWEEEQREWEAMSREMDARRAEEARDTGEPASESIITRDSVWTRSYSNQEALEDVPPSEAFGLRLFGIGGHLAELLLDLKASEKSETLGATLNRDWSNLLECLGTETPGLPDATLRRFCEDLAAVSVVRPDLADKSQDLMRGLEQLLEGVR